MVHFLERREGAYFGFVSGGIFGGEVTLGLSGLPVLVLERLSKARLEPLLV
jgi:hypothetical protein